MFTARTILTLFVPLLARRADASHAQAPAQAGAGRASTGDAACGGRSLRRLPTLRSRQLRCRRAPSCPPTT